MATVIGTWVFDTTKSLDLTMFSESGYRYIDYTTNGLDYQNVVRSYPGTEMHLSNSGWHCAWQNYNNQVIYNKDKWNWFYQNGLAITVTGGADADKEDLVAFFTANATRVVEVPTKIVYNGLEIASIKSGQTATLACAGNIIYSDIMIRFGAAGTITYNGTETAVDSGQTATLACAGKKMKTDVVVTL